MKKLLSMALALCMLFALCAVSASAADKPITIKLTTTNGSTNPEVVCITEACEAIKEKTDGKVDIQVYPDGQMLVYSEGIEAVMSNSNVIYYTACNLFSDYVPEFTTVYLPYLFENTVIADLFFKSDLWKEISAKSDSVGLHVICNNGFNGYRSIYANKPVHTAADVEGLTLRIPDSTLYIETFKALKANYMPLPGSEIYSALQTGMIDGAEGTCKGAFNANLWEMKNQMYYSLTNHIQDNAGFFVGYDFWMSIPEEYRAIIEEEFYNALAKGNEINDEKAQAYVDQMREKGVEVVEIEDYSSFQAAVEDLVKSSPMGEEVLNQIAEIKASLG